MTQNQSSVNLQKLFEQDKERLAERLREILAIDKGDIKPSPRSMSKRVLPKTDESNSSEYTSLFCTSF